MDTFLNDIKFSCCMIGWQNCLKEARCFAVSPRNALDSGALGKSLDRLAFPNCWSAGCDGDGTKVWNIRDTGTPWNMRKTVLKKIREDMGQTDFEVVSRLNTQVHLFVYSVSILETGGGGVDVTWCYYCCCCVVVVVVVAVAVAVAAVFGCLHFEQTVFLTILTRASMHIIVCLFVCL